MYDPIFHKVVSAVVFATGVPAHEIFGRLRTETVSRARHIAFLFAKRNSTASLAEIGSFFGGRSHTTVMLGLRRVTERLELPNEKTLQHLVEQVSTRLEWIKGGESEYVLFSPIWATLEEAERSVVAAREAMLATATARARGHLMDALRLVSESLFKLGQVDACTSSLQVQIQEIAAK